MSQRLPWDKWSYEAWMRDPGLRRCSAASRGIWKDMLCLMDASPERGYLVVRGRPATATEIARATGNDARTVTRAINQLGENGVYSRDDRGVIFNRRMSRSRPQEAVAKPAKTRAAAEMQHSCSKDAADLQQGRMRVSSKNKGLANRKRREEEIRKSPPSVDSEAAPAQTGDMLGKGEVVPFVGSPTREAFDAWNAMAKRIGLCPALSFSEPRKRRLATRLAEAGGMPGWMAMLLEVEASDWLCGRLPGRHWRADLDWVMRPDRFHTVREGGARNWGKGGSGSGTGHEWMAAPETGPEEFEFDGTTLDGEAEEA